jgi:hypothetical protein
VATKSAESVETLDRNLARVQAALARIKTAFRKSGTTPPEEIHEISKLLRRVGDALKVAQAIMPERKGGEVAAAELSKFDRRVVVLCKDMDEFMRRTSERVA